MGGAKPAQLDEIEISPSGFGIHFPKIDVDVYLPSLLEGFVGSRRRMTARLLNGAGQRSSGAKVAARGNRRRLDGNGRKTAAE